MLEVVRGFSALASSHDPNTSREANWQLRVAPRPEWVFKKRLFVSLTRPRDEPVTWSGRNPTFTLG